MTAFGAGFAACFFARNPFANAPPAPPPNAARSWARRLNSWTVRKPLWSVSSRWKTRSSWAGVFWTAAFLKTGADANQLDELVHREFPVEIRVTERESPLGVGCLHLLPACGNGAAPTNSSPSRP